MEQTENTGGNLFDKEATVSQSASGIVRLLILQRWDAAIRQWEIYNNIQEGSGNKDRAGRRCKNSIKALLAWLGTRMKDKNKLSGVEEDLKEDNFEDAVMKIAEYLEKDLKLTHISTRHEYDKTNWEQSIKARKG